MPDFHPSLADERHGGEFGKALPPGEFEAFLAVARRGRHIAPQHRGDEIREQREPVGMRTLDQLRHIQGGLRLTGALLRVAHHGMGQSEIEPPKDAELLQEARVELAMQRRVVALHGRAQMRERRRIVAAVPCHQAAHGMRGEEGAVRRFRLQYLEYLVGRLSASASLPQAQACSAVL